MARNDVEMVQSFLRKYLNKEVRKHFSDAGGSDSNSLSLDSPRTAIKAVCLHKDNDPITLSLLRCLIYWVEARGLFNDIIYGIPSEQFEISHTYYPQVKLHFREDKYGAADANRKQARGEVSFRWKESDFSTANINRLVTKIVDDFVTPVFFYKRGRELWTYSDKSTGYYFQMTVDDEENAKKVISQVMGVQNDTQPDWEKYLRTHKDKKNYSVQETIRVMGETRRKPRRRPIARVEFAYAELFIPGTTKPIILVDRTGNKADALQYA